MKYYFVLGDIATPYNSYEEANEEFCDMLDYYEHYNASISCFNADKVLITTDSDKLYMSIVSEDDFKPMAHKFMII